MGIALTPQVGYYYNVVAEAVSDKKNIAMTLMGTYLVRNMFKSKL